MSRGLAVLVRVQHFVARVPDDAELLLALWDAGPRQLTEPLVLRWTRRAPLDHHRAVLFTVLTHTNIDGTRSDYRKRLK